MSSLPPQSLSQPAESDQTKIKSFIDVVAKATERLGVAGDWRAALPEILETLGVVTEAERFLFCDVQKSGSGTHSCSCSVEWTRATGVAESADRGWRRLNFSSDLGPWINSFESNEPIWSRVSDLPVIERIMFDPEGIQSFVTYPVIVDGEVKAFLRLDFVAERQPVSPIAFQLIGIVTRQIAAVMSRSRRESTDRQAENMVVMGRMAGGVAHDLNNLLTVLGGALELSRLGLESGDPMRKTALGNLDHADRAMAQTTDLLRRLLEFSQVREGRPETLCPGDFIVAMKSVLQQLVGRAIEIIVDRDSLTDRVRIDPVRMEQMITCLVVNARDSMPEGGSLRITLSSGTDQGKNACLQGPGSEGWVSIRIVDDGTGMPPSVEERIFEPFFSTKAAGRGIGLGLVTVYTAVKGSGGRITVDSTPGSGTTFRIDLPAVEATATPEPFTVDDLAGRPSTQSCFGS